MNPLLLADAYKFFHREQYPKGVTKVFSNWTPRNTRVEGETGVIHFGLQYFMKKILQDEFNNNFFGEDFTDSC